jgi:hypothetical protein
MERLTRAVDQEKLVPVEIPYYEYQIEELVEFEFEFSFVEFGIYSIVDLLGRQQKHAAETERQR